MTKREDRARPRILAAIFDLDGVLVDSERWWAASRAEVAARHGRTWTERDEAAVKGANSREWSAAMRERLALGMSDAEIEHEVVTTMVARYRDGGPAGIEPGIDAVRRLGTRWQLAVASSAHPEVIRVGLRSIGLEAAFRVVVSADEVGRGKPAPDVYLEAARRLSVRPAACLVVEDSPSGVEAAHSAGMRVVWVGGDAERSGGRRPATLVVDTLAALDDAALDDLSRGDRPRGG